MKLILKQLVLDETGSLPSYQGLIKVDGQWHAAFHLSRACDSAIEAINEAMLGGLSIHDASYQFDRFGTTLGECYKENPEKTMEFMRTLRGYLQDDEGRLKTENMDARCFHQYRDDLNKLLAHHVQVGQTELSEILGEMIALCEGPMVEGGIPLDSNYYESD
jgi:hypothetical protein